MYICVAEGSGGVEPVEDQRQRCEGRPVGGQQAVTAVNHRHKEPINPYSHETHKTYLG